MRVSTTFPHVRGILSVLFLLLAIISTPSQAQRVVKVRYGYFPETRPVRAACARGFLNKMIGNTQYEVTCYPQTSGGYVASRLDSNQLDLADMGSTPLAQALARGVDISVIFLSDYKGESQGIYVRPSSESYVGVENPFDLVNKTVGVPFGSTIHYQLLYLLDLFGIAGSVKLRNLSPTEIVEAWNKREIDAAACWGPAREHVLGEGGGPPSSDASYVAKTLVSAGVMGDWGRPTFGVIAARRAFLDEHPGFARYFAAVWGRLTDSFIDNLGIWDTANVARWTPSLNATTSFMPSLADCMMSPDEISMSPSANFTNQQRRALDLFVSQSIREQISCDYLASPSDCRKPSLLHVALRQTAEFLMDQKVIHSLGIMQYMGEDTGCEISNFFCGSNALDRTFLFEGQQLYSASQIFLPSNPFPPSEIGRYGGDSDCVAGRLIYLDRQSYTFSDGPIPLTGRSYSDSLYCNWSIHASRSCENDPDCRTKLDLNFQEVKVWSSDIIRVYSDPSGRCRKDSPNLVLLGQVTGFPQNLPPFRAVKCLFVEFETDGNQERIYGGPINSSGDGFVATVQQEPDTGCNCALGGCDVQTLCKCNGLSWGGDCSFTDHCLGTNFISLEGNYSPRTIASSRALESGLSGATEPYPNELDCVFEIQANNIGNQPVVKFEVEYDLETSFDFLQLYTGSLSSSNGLAKLYTTLTGSSKAGKETYYIPVDDEGKATIRLVTDSRGRRTGFSGSVITDSSPPKTCNDGESGFLCEVPHCIPYSDFGAVRSQLYTNPSFHVGRVMSHKSDGILPPISLSCSWSLGNATPLSRTDTIRIVFEEPLDLEPHRSQEVGDQLAISSTVIFSESCTSDEQCSHDWQTGVCDQNTGACSVKTAFDLPIEDANSVIVLSTDRNDNGKSYRGVFFDAVFVESCPAGDGQQHCELGKGGKCVDGLCICEGGTACSCPCDGNKVVSELDGGLLAAIIIPLILVAALIFWWYRRRKIQRSRAQKAVIAQKEEELDAFRNSVVGMRTATTLYLPKSKTIRPSVIGQERPIADTSLMQPPTKKIQWCWKETPHIMVNHAPDMIVGDPNDCWIKYDAGQNIILEKAYQEYLKKTSSKNRRFTYPLPGYKVDLQDMIQTKEATGFKRDVLRIEQIQDALPARAISDRKEVDMDDVVIGDLLPEDIREEPQMVLVKGDVIQISSQRQDGWAFGTKLHHEDEAVARQLVHLATTGIATDEANVFTDTGWFPMEHTEIPTGEQLAVLQSKVGDTGSLDPPSYWDAVNDPSLVQKHPLGKDDKEREAVIKAFKSTLKPPNFNKKVKIINVERIQNLAMWQSYVVKRQTICYRETGADATAQAYNKAIERFERFWLWHGTNVEVMDKIMQQGFNRSFCGKNATVYGKGVYFARDASYSAYPTYSVPDKKGHQYIMACRVIVGEYCPGVQNALTPDIRDPQTQTLYDSTVGLLSGDDMSSPSIYVTYHDAQAYPEYLIEFKLS